METTTMNDIVDVTAIRQLNDELRQTLRGGIVTMTPGVMALGEVRQLEVLKAVARFDRFDADNDPHGEHDLGSLDVGGERVLWKIDYFDRALTNHSPGPTDPAVTTRVLTIMLRNTEPQPVVSTRRTHARSGGRCGHCRAEEEEGAQNRAAREQQRS